MVLLIWILSIVSHGFGSDLSTGLATDLLHMYEPKYFPNLPNEDTQNEFMNTPSNNEDNQSTKLKDKLLSILHSEESNKVVLESMHANDSTEIKEISTGNINAIDSDDYILRVGNNLLNAKILAKRSAIKALKQMFVGKYFPTHKKSSSLRSDEVKNSNYINSNSNYVNDEFANIFVTLTNAITTLNENLGKLQLQVNNDAYISVRVPIDEADITVSHNKDDAYRSKRDDDVGNVMTKLIRKDIKLVANIAEKPIAEPIANISNTKQLNEISSDETSNESNETLVLISKREVTSGKIDTTTEIYESKSAEKANVNSKVVNRLSLRTEVDEIPDDNSTKDIHVVTLRNSNNKSIDVNSNDLIELRAHEINNTKYSLENSTHTNNSYLRYLQEPNISLTQSFNEKEDMIFEIESIIQNITEQLLPIDDIKHMYSSQVIYKIGYVVASLDTLKTTLAKLKMKLTLNKDNWELKKLSGIKQKIQLTKQHVASVIKHLQTYTNGLELNADYL